ncbi:hypothetical protein, partial [Luteitalea sp.]|uniref:hypothetical protein n=1 Tax=Luteitalea sp. TaxID=2004800 RepID=UPI0025B96B0D
MTLPKVKVTLGDVCELVCQQVDPRARPKAAYLGLEHLATGRLLPIATGSASDVTSQKTAYEAGDVLVSKLRPYLDKAVLATEPGVCSTELLPLRPKEGIDSRFLACVVHRPDFVEHAMTGVTGSQHPRTSWAHLSRFVLHPMPIEDQRTVATLLWRIHELIVVVEATLRSAESLKEAAASNIFARGLRREPDETSGVSQKRVTWDV